MWSWGHAIESENGTVVPLVFKYVEPQSCWGATCVDNTDSYAYCMKWYARAYISTV